MNAEPPERVSLEGLGERGLIRRIRRSAAASPGAPDVEVGIGDDTAVLAVPPGHKLLATTDELERIAAGQEHLSGWRQELFGADAEALRDGKLMLGLERGRRGERFQCPIADGGGGHQCANRNARSTAILFAGRAVS